MAYHFVDKKKTTKFKRTKFIKNDIFKKILQSYNKCRLALIHLRFLQLALSFLN